MVTLKVKGKKAGKSITRASSGITLLDAIEAVINARIGDTKTIKVFDTIERIDVLDYNTLINK